MKSLTKKQFHILCYLSETPDKKTTQQEIAEQVKLSAETVNRILSSLTELDYVAHGKITAKGLQALEPYRVKRAIFIAAGFGSRLVPLTLNTPKPLIRVKGVRMIDTLLDAVVAAGIEEIIVVRGYLWEQFDQLLYKYPQIKFVENLAYNQANNISSAMCVRHLFRQSYVFDADLVLSNPKLITKYQYCSNYLGVPVEETDDWCLKTEKGYICRMCLGGKNCYHMFGISYWDEIDGAKLEEDIKSVYNSPGGKECYWDQVALEYFHSRYQIEVRPCCFDDIKEFDNYRDLKEFDKAYQ